MTSTAQVTDGFDSKVFEAYSSKSSRSKKPEIGRKTLNKFAIFKNAKIKLTFTGYLVLDSASSAVVYGLRIMTSMVRLVTIIIGSFHK